MVNGVSRRERPGWSWLAVGAMTAVWVVTLAHLAITRHLAFATRFDLAVYSHVVWTTSQGKPFFNSLVEGTTNFLGHHFSPLLALLAPLYLAWPDARVLLFMQTLALALAVFPLFAFARRRLGDGVALAVVVAFLLSPLVHYVALFDFHEIALVVPLLMAAGAALLDRRRFAVVIWLGLALLVKEEVALIALGFGLYALAIQRDVRFGLGLTGGVLAWAALVFGYFMPKLGNSGGGYGFFARYTSLGDSPGQALRHILTRPVLLAEVIATRSKATFIGQLLAPLAGLPLLGWPAVLLTLPPLAYLLLSDYEPQTSIRYHYTAPLIPLLFLATVIGLQRLRRRKQSWAIAGGVILISASAFCAWRWSPLPGGGGYVPVNFVIDDEAQAIRKLLAQIPDDAAVTAEQTYQPWLATRWWIADLATVPFDQFRSPQVPDYLVAREPGPYAEPTSPEFPWILPNRSLNTSGISHTSDLVRVPRYYQIDRTAGGVVLWQRLPEDQDVVLEPIELPFDRGLSLVAAGTPHEAPDWAPTMQVKRGSTLPVWMAWAADAPLDSRITFSLHLVDADDALVAQVDTEMQQGRFPTTLWHRWMTDPVVAGEFPLELPANLSPGRYRLLAGAFETDTITPLVQPGGSPWVQLAVLEVD